MNTESQVERIVLSDNFNQMKTQIEHIFNDVLNAGKTETVNLVHRAVGLLESLPLDEMTDLRSIMNDLEQGLGTRLDDLENRVADLESQVNAIDQKTRTKAVGADAPGVPAIKQHDELLPAELQDPDEGELKDLQARLAALEHKSGTSDESS